MLTTLARPLPYLEHTMTNDTTPMTSQTPETKVPLEPAIPAPGAQEKHERIDEAIEKVDHKANESY